MLAQADSPISQVERPKTRRRGIKKPSKERIWTFCCCLPFGGNVNTNLKKFKDKSTKDLFPEYLLPPPCSRDIGKKTLVLDLDETLVHSSFKPIEKADFVISVEIETQIHDIYVLKRPGVDEFLRKMGDLFEVVIFTASLATYADPVLDLLDKNGVIRARLFREACQSHGGNYVKDLSKLGRTLKSILIVDNSPFSYQWHKDNAIPCESWFDDQNDRQLENLTPLLLELASEDDVRIGLKNFNSQLSKGNNKGVTT